MAPGRGAGAWQHPQLLLRFPRLGANLHAKDNERGWEKGSGLWGAAQGLEKQGKGVQGHGIALG